MGEIVYFLRGDPHRAYLNITPRYECTNNCVFCDKQLLEEKVAARLYLKKAPTLDEIIGKLKAKVDREKVNEFVFCGLGEPLLYLSKVVNVTNYIKREYQKPVRINTNGQAYTLYPHMNVVKQLEKAGVDSISISLNVTDESSYRMLHKPRAEDAFNHMLRFIKDCNSSSINTTVTFLEFPKLKKEKVLEFTRSLGLKNSQVRFRPFIRKE
jgi:TatD family-associated radical SAM protein